MIVISTKIFTILFVSLNSVLLLFCRETCDSCKGNSTTGNVNKKNVQSVVKTKEPKPDEPKVGSHETEYKPEDEEKNNADEEKVQELLNVLEDDYGIKGLMDEEVAKNKIRELNFDKDALFGWVENYLLNGE